MASTTSKLAIMLIIGLIVGAVPAYYYGTTTVPSGQTTITQTKTQTVTQTVTSTTVTGPKVPLLVTMFGGPMTNFFTQSGVKERFEERYNAIVTIDSQTGAQQKTKLAAQAVNPQYDVATLDGQDVLFVAKSGLVINLTDSEFPNRLDCNPVTRVGNYGVALYTSLTGISYNPKFVANTSLPKTWADLLDAKWKGKIGIIQPPHIYGLLMMLEMARIAGGDQYSIEKGYSNLQKLKPNVGIVQTSVYTEVTSLMSGEIWIMPDVIATSASYTATNPDLIQFVTLDDVPYYNAGCPVVVANRPAVNQAMAKLWVNYCFSQEVQQLWAEWAYNIPANTKAAVSPNWQRVMGGITPAILNTVKPLDSTYLSSISQNWTQKFQEVWAAA